MFLKTEDGRGPVCVNLDTGLRFRPNADKNVQNGLGVQIIFPDGSTNIVVRGDYESLTQAVEARDGRLAV